MNSFETHRFLKDLHIGPLWVLRDPESGDSLENQSTPQATQMLEESVNETASNMQPAVAGVQSNPPSISPATSSPATSAIRIELNQDLGWDELQAQVSSCTLCGLCHSRQSTVFGVGDKNARVLLVGEGPGYHENIQGEPFVGEAGKLLNQMLKSLKMERGQFNYIANIVKCRASDASGKDRAPTAEEIATCFPYLKRQIELLQPELIIALGKTAAISLLHLDAATPVNQLRGKVHRYASIPLVVTYHPAYLLRQPADKSKAWADLCMAFDTIAV